jgi:hypothetical protein
VLLGTLASNRNRLSEPVAEAYGLVLRAVLAIHTRVRVTHECDIDFTGHAAKRKASMKEWRNEWQRPTLQVVQNQHERPAGSVYNRQRDSLSPTPVGSVIAIIVAIVIAGVRCRIAVPGRVVVNNGSGLSIRSWW